LFVLYRNRPEVFTNRHAVESYQAVVRRRDTIGQNSKLHYGIETNSDSIVSNNLGYHARTRGAGYVAVDVRALRRFSFSAGLRDEFYGSGNHELSPTLSAGAWLAPAVKLRAGLSRAFRLPTYTDLYYHDPANVGSANLRPEKAWSYEAGIDYNAGGKVKGTLTVFQRRETDGIDYVRRSETDVWRATNFQSLRFSGLEAGVRAIVAKHQELEVQYTGLRGAQNILSGVVSKYVFNYPVHSGIVTWQGVLPWNIVARTRVGVLQRFSREAYGVWDVYATATRGRVRPFAQATNVNGATYEEIPRVAMPGRAMIGGLEVVVFGPR
jgi:iron complex outermembrane receptor protein